MGKKKRASSDGSKLLKRAGKTAQEVIHEAQRRLPPDIVQQLEKGLGNVQKNVAQAYKDLQKQVNRAASKSDVDRLGKRIDDLAKQVEAVAKGATAARARRAPGRSTSTSARKPAARKATTTRRASSSTPKPPTRGSGGST